MWPTTLTKSSLEELQARIQGAVVLPDDANYDETRKAWNLAVEQRPAMIVVAESASDVAEAVRFARQEELSIAVQSTGHGVVRPADDALLIITSNLNRVRIDPEARTAWIEAGVKWGQVLEKAQEFGLAPLLGSSPGVGAVGYTLGGGMGWLARKYGLSTDSVRCFEVVTADGRMLRVSDTENSDLFWGMRGGGGSLAIVIGMEVQLYPVTTVYGGNLIYPADMAKEVITFYRDWIADAPEELTSSFAIMNLPPIPDIPEFLRGKSVVMIRGCYIGPVETGETLIQKWLDWKAPIANLFHAMPFTEVGTISNDPKGPVSGISSGAWVRELTDEAIDLMVQYAVSRNGSSPLVSTEVRHAGGAIARVDRNANAYGNRDARHIMQMIAMLPTPEARSSIEQYIARFKNELQPYLTGGVYMNFLEGKESRERVKDGYLEENFRRLTEIKTQYDPDNFLSHSFNIRPR
ncbi:MAG: FAD-binding oxidoreductase [Anaerolineae bacterium]|nr:MAG: FAD-binding oxidoreductase [Anaerolineae bacterium]